MSAASGDVLPGSRRLRERVHSHLLLAAAEHFLLLRNRASSPPDDGLRVRRTPQVTIAAETFGGALPDRLAVDAVSIDIVQRLHALV